MTDDKKKQVSLKWEGHYLHFGLYPDAEATRKMNLIKILASKWGRDDPKPSKEWVDSEIRRRLSIPRTNINRSASTSINRSTHKGSAGYISSVPENRPKVSLRKSTAATIYYNADFQITPKIIKENRGLISGKWIRDKRIEPISLRGHFEAMGISKDAIESHVKKDETMDIICEMLLTPDSFKVRAFYIQDVESQPQSMSFPLGKEVLERSGAMRTLVTSNHPTSVIMKRSILAVTGFTEVCDTKQIVLFTDVKLPENYTERPDYMMRQTVTVENHKSQKKHTMTRYYLPFDKG